jgi:hypothetical protein
MTRARSRNPESGYALLLVFAMAATVAIMLYSQLPRVAFEAQRDKEQLLIDRGEQYTRAVQLFVRKYNRFPTDIQALENTQNIRFLRKQYVDPLTGKNEWRLIHVGPGGVFTDSLTHQAKKKDQNAPQTFITELQQIGGNTVNPNEGVNLATRRRPSDQPGAPGDPNSAGPDGGSQPAQGSQPGAPPISGPVMVLPDGRIVAASTSGQPPTTQQGTPNQPGNQPAPPGGIGLQSGFGQPGQQGQPNLPPGFQSQPNVPSGGAANLINQILTTPRPQPGQGGDLTNTGFAGLGAQGAGTSNTGTPLGQGLGGSTIGGGIAGVASKIEREGIKKYNDRTAYNEWEFVYDMTKDPARTGGQQQPQQQQQPGGAPGGIAPQSGTTPTTSPGPMTAPQPTTTP